MSYTSNSRASSGYSSYGSSSPASYLYNQSTCDRPSSSSGYSDIKSRSASSVQSRHGGYHSYDLRDEARHMYDRSGDGSERFSDGSSVGIYTAQNSPTFSSYSAGESQGRYSYSRPGSPRSPYHDSETSSNLVPSMYPSPPGSPFHVPSTGYSYSRPPESPLSNGSGHPDDIRASD
ncbi:hypothetical protein I302_100868 [Kwoniella bestiolae CBS 10118]|uniref:Uncharacterized protein n=1 Tax=Kwoniella bestiolae CBS 10118 TaxID=1296100 RepID=A0A1B9G6A2_9TREE|nr:hypothetical protein I302_04242 [Kwoniella bestiolae CBS 10118]OCF26556.1 hypothetical protein I302_04242 [Kwoniella bestiolae CBS 10118]